MKIEHIGIAVKELTTSVPLFEQLLNTPCYKTEKVENEGVNTAFFMTGPSKIELLEATKEESPIAKFIAKKGEGIHHIAITADEIENDVNHAKENGMRFLGELRTGSYGRKITFIHPKSLNGVLVEFCQAPPR